MTVTSLELENVGPFRFRAAAVPKKNDFKVRIEFDKDVNLFIGPNNVGKSTILQAVRLLTERWTEEFSERYMQSVSASPDDNFASVSMEWRDSQHQNVRFESKYSDLYRVLGAIANNARRDRRGDAYRTNMGMGHIQTQQAVDRVANETVGAIKYLNMAADSANCSYREWEEHKNKHLGYVGYATHATYNLENADSLVGYSQGHSDFDRDVYVTMSRTIAQIMHGFPIQPSVTDRRANAISFQTADGQVSFADLSLGTRYALAWVIQFVDSFAQRYRNAADWSERPGILIIDEVDAHLHPSWQRRIIPTLKEYFRNVQIFASTHSPMMVAGLKTGQVHLLNRDDTGTVTWSRNGRDIIGWTADEIYRTFMGIDDPTDARTARHAQELRELRNKDSLTVEDEARMQELRRLVNEDLLARGALNAQDERFDEMMRRVMANRRSDLSQDGV